MITDAPSITGSPSETTAPTSNGSTLLTAHDECDRCGAQAYVRVTVKVGDLLFCAHHYREHEPALFAYGYTVDDQRFRLEEIS